jgi:dihydrofolate synthase/folylpolyglutamate synthase
VREIAERTAGERGAELIVAPEDPGPGVRLRAHGPFQRRNFALACAAAEAFLGELDGERAAAVAASLEIRGRLERVGEDPPAFLDAAHNAEAAAALAEALPLVTGGGPVVACLSVLADKDTEAIVATLAKALDRVVCTEVHAPRPAFPAADLVQICEQAGLPAEAVHDFRQAVSHARQLALADGANLLVAGSHYALAPARLALGLCED